MFHKLPIHRPVYSGFVRLVDVMPRFYESEVLRSDEAVVRAARVSYGSGSKTVKQDTDLIHYLWENKHHVPFESVVYQWHVKVPIFVQRHIVKHRMSSMNEISGRYTTFRETDYYTPQFFRKQAKKNKQASESVNDSNDRLAKSISENRFSNTEHHKMMTDLDEHMKSTFKLYNSLLDKGVAREMARMVLPQNVMTEFYFKIDLRNLYHFLTLRNDNHAQEETREIAKAMEGIVKEINPVSYEAFCKK